MMMTLLPLNLCNARITWQTKLFLTHALALDVLSSSVSSHFVCSFVSLDFLTFSFRLGSDSVVNVYEKRSGRRETGSMDVSSPFWLFDRYDDDDAGRCFHKFLLFIYGKHFDVCCVRFVHFMLFSPFFFLPFVHSSSSPFGIHMISDMCSMYERTNVWFCMGLVWLGGM